MVLKVQQYCKAVLKVQDWSSIALSYIYCVIWEMYLIHLNFSFVLKWQYFIWSFWGHIIPLAQCPKHGKPLLSLLIFQQSPHNPFIFKEVQEHMWSLEHVSWHMSLLIHRTLVWEKVDSQPTNQPESGQLSNSTVTIPCSSDGKKSSCNEEDLGLIPGLGRSPGGGHGNPLQYSCLKNPHGQRSLAGYSSWGGQELDTTEWLSTHNIFPIHTSKIMEAYVPFLTYLCMGWAVADCKEIEMGWVKSTSRSKEKLQMSPQAACQSWDLMGKRKSYFYLKIFPLDQVYWAWHFSMRILTLKGVRLRDLCTSF